MSLNMKTCFAILALLLFPALLQAQTYSIDWYTVAGGGGASTGGAYTVTGTIGQSDAGTLAGGAYSLTGGFWGIIATVQTPGSPLLIIKVVNSTHVALSWVSASTGFVPQQDASLGNTNWTRINTNTFPIVVNGGTNTCTVPVGGNQFFRLINP